MSLKKYFEDLIKKVEESPEITNATKDDNGFYKPKRTIVLRNLNMLKDLHDKPLAKAMLKSAWTSVVEELPPEWLVLNPEDKKALSEILK